MPVKERQIGKISGFTNYEVFVELDIEYNGNYKSLMGSTHKVLSLNSFVTIPMLCEKLIGVVQKISIEPEKLPKGNGIYITQNKKILEVKLIGRIININKGKQVFEEGVNIYPSLEAPVCFISDEELSIIFHTFGDNAEVQIGTNVQFNQPVHLNFDKFLGMHSAILGNTGTGKSHTVTAILRAILEKVTLNNEDSPATIILFDTNGEYKKAFNEIPNCNVNYFSNTPDSTEISKNEFFIPYWYLNSQEFFDLFNASVKSQQPFLSSLLSIAKLEKKMDSNLSSELRNLTKRELYNRLERLLKKYETDEPAAFPIAKSISLHIEALINRLGIPYTKDNLFEKYFDKNKRQNVYNPTIDPTKINDFLIQMRILPCYEEVSSCYLNSDVFLNSIADKPLYFEVDKLLNEIWDITLFLSEDFKMGDYVSTLRWRIKSTLANQEYRKILALDIRENKTKINLADFLLEKLCGYDYLLPAHKTHQVLIIDTSFMNQKSLSIVTSVISRLILDIQKRIRAQNKNLLNPITIVLEEAHNYIPNRQENPEESILIASKQTFEKIAKEGRKYGLSLILSSQRPSELSKTVLSQCNSFVIHRIQNPVDLDIIRKSVPYLSKEIFEQLTCLQRQSALVFGQAFKMPTIVKINTLSKEHSPDSNDIKYSSYWSGIDETSEKFNHKDYCELIKYISNNLEMKVKTDK